MAWSVDEVLNNAAVQAAVEALAVAIHYDSSEITQQIRNGLEAVQPYAEDPKVSMGFAFDSNLRLSVRACGAEHAHVVLLAAIIDSLLLQNAHHLVSE